MLDNVLSADQVRAAAGVAFAEAQAACYMASAADRTVAEFCASTGFTIRRCREQAFRWGVQFTDYDPFAKAKQLTWVKLKVGWELRDGEDAIGDCQRTPAGKYRARLFSRIEVENWDRARAMRELAAEIDALSSDLPGFHGKPVRVVEVTDAGLVFDVIFPVTDEDVQRCRDALQFRTLTKVAA